MKKFKLRWNIPNLITSVRIILIPVLVFFFYLDSGKKGLQGDWGKKWAFWLFIIIALSDWLDGFFARLNKETTDFGKFFDPLADKLLNGTMFILLCEYSRFTKFYGWLVALLLGREFFVSTLRTWMSNYNIDVAASWTAKWKTVFQSITIGVGMYYLIGISGYWRDFWLMKSVYGHYNYWYYISMGLTVVLSLYSAIEYFINFYKKTKGRIVE